MTHSDIYFTILITMYDCNQSDYIFQSERGRNRERERERERERGREGGRERETH